MSLGVRAWGAVLSVCLLLAACQPASSTSPAAPTTSPRDLPAPVLRPAVAAAGVSKVLVVVEENHSYAQMRAGMPYLSGLAQSYGYATDYRGVAHPSLPNYLAIAGGSTFGVHDDRSPAAHPVAGQSVFGQALAAGRSARLYAEAMPATCATTPRDGYAVKHAPWAYFTDERTACAVGMVPAGTPAGGALAADIAAGRLPDVGMLIPDLDHDAHDGSLAAADGWLRQWLAPMLAGPDFRAGRLAVVVTADEDNGGGGNIVLTVVVAPGVSHRVVNAPLDHYSLTRWLDQAAGGPPLRAAANATSLGSAFGVRVAAG